MALADLWVREVPKTPRSQAQQPNNGLSPQRISPRSPGHTNWLRGELVVVSVAFGVEECLDVLYRLIPVHESYAFDLEHRRTSFYTEQAGNISGSHRLDSLLGAQTSCRSYSRKAPGARQSCNPRPGASET